MEFGTPPRNEEVAAFPMKKMPPPLRAEGNLDYLQFITLVRNLWAETHPDIPIRPVQSSKYAKYPVIVYGLQSRSTVTNESKSRHRETVYQVDQQRNLLIKGQRFNNIVTFTVITENNPEVCEAIIETFERFMDEQTPVFKELGASEFVFSRRLPDRERTRPDEDIEERSVAYMVTLERVIVREITTLQEIIVKARVMLTNYWQGVEFWAFDPDDEFGIPSELYVPNNPFREADLVRILPPSDFQDDEANDIAEFSVPRAIPDGLKYNWMYQVASRTDESVVLAELNGDPTVLRGSGMGRLTGVDDTSPFVQAEIIDEFQSATPSY